MTTGFAYNDSIGFLDKDLNAFREGKGKGVLGEGAFA